MEVSPRASAIALMLAAGLFAAALPRPAAGPAPCRRAVEVSARAGHTAAVACTERAGPAGPLRGPARRLFGRPIDVNRADAATLASLPGIGPARAAAIVAERGVRPFASVEELTRVRGLGPALVGRLRDYVAAAPLAPGAGSR